MNGRKNDRGARAAARRWINLIGELSLALWTRGTRYRAVIELDGAQGEGGGQILRTALSLSMLTCTPLHIRRIRAARPKPGLRNQHLTAVRAAQAISRADVEGAELRSTELTFRPRRVAAGNYRFEMATAGSTTLVAQTLIPALLGARARSKLTLIGGTHNPQSPSYEFLAHAFLPLLARMGARVEAELQRPGYFPAGGGVLQLRINPAARLRPVDLLQRGALMATDARAVVSRLPLSIAERELAIVRRELGWQTLAAEEETRSAGPGNVLLLKLDFENLTELFTGFGQPRVPAETVARRVAREVRIYLDSGAAVGPHLADQLLLPLALAGEGSFTTLRPSGHLTTNAAVIERFLPVRISMARTADQLWTVSLRARVTP